MDGGKVGEDEDNGFELLVRDSFYLAAPTVSTRTRPASVRMERPSRDSTHSMPGESLLYIAIGSVLHWNGPKPSPSSPLTKCRIPFTIGSGSTLARKT